MPGPTHCAVWEGFGGEISHHYDTASSQHNVTHRTVLSVEPDAMVLPSGLMATLRTYSVCPTSVLVHSPDIRSHRHTLGRVGRFRRGN